MKHTRYKTPLSEYPLTVCKPSIITRNIPLQVIFLYYHKYRQMLEKTGTSMAGRYIILNTRPSILQPKRDMYSPNVPIAHCYFTNY